MSAQCLLCKTEKAQISGQMQIICTGWHLCLYVVSVNHLVKLFHVQGFISEGCNVEISPEKYQLIIL